MKKIELFLCTIILILIISVLIYIGTLGPRLKCSNAWDDSREPQYGMLAGCTILHKGERIPAENLKLE